MKAVVFVCLIALALADKKAEIQSQEFQIEEDGSYVASYKTSNGIEVQEDGISYPGNEPETGNYVRTGSYSYIWEGVTYTVNWTADENGYHAVGDHLPDYSHTRAHIADVSEYE